MSPPSVDFQCLFEQMLGAALVLAPDDGFTVLWVTEAYERATQRGREELLGRPLFEAFGGGASAVPPMDMRDLRASLERVVATRAPDRMAPQKYAVVGPNGLSEERHGRFINNPIFAADGALRYLVHQLVDVTPLLHPGKDGDSDGLGQSAARPAEAHSAELHRKDVYLRRILEANRVGTWELELATHSVEADARLLELFFMSEPRRRLDEFFARIHPDDIPRTATAIQDAIAGKNEGRYSVEYRVVDPVTGGTRWLEARGQAYFKASGEAERFYGTVLDIHERKVAALLRDGLLEALAAQPVIFVALLRGADLTFELTNSLYESLFRGQQLVGRPLLEAVPELRGQGLDTLMYDAMRSGRPFIGREMVVPLVRGTDGVLEDVIFNFVYQPVRGAEGTYDGILIMGVEVTEEVRAREEARARLAYEERLTGIVGHDLRSPLSALRLSAAQLAPGGPYAAGLTEAQVRAIQRVTRGAERIQGVISSLLDLTRARGERGFPLQPAHGDLDVTVRRVLDEVRASYPDRMVRYAPEGDTTGRFDSERVAQVVANLLENAFKYGDPTSAVLLRCQGTENWLRLVVHNEGAPIDAELQGRLFHPFVQGPQSAGTVKLSLGLGLYIVREIIRAHGGHVSLQSSAEEGTTVTVELPREGPHPSS